MPVVAGVAVDFLFDTFDAIKTNTFKIALYQPGAALDKNTLTAYTTTGEISGAGYTAGGITLANVTVTQENNTVIFSFDNPEWPAATFSATAALVYDSTNADQALAVIDFGDIISASAETFRINRPDPTSSRGAIRLA